VDVFRRFRLLLGRDRDLKSTGDLYIDLLDGFGANSRDPENRVVRELFLCLVGKLERDLYFPYASEAVERDARISAVAEESFS
jgi:hypothetical protein